MSDIPRLSALSLASSMNYFNIEVESFNRGAAEPQGACSGLRYRPDINPHSLKGGSSNGR
jgi:hypothetical protein